MSDALYKALGGAIRSRRESLGISQSSLARRIGAARTTVTNIEAGGQSIMVHQLMEIARALRMPVSTLLDVIDGFENEPQEEAVDPKMETLLMKLTTPVKAKRI
ncbi:helix-turn-helix domain-containing protein [Tropicibacter alexandrii]|uniref:helix-turn-helix domain-containing protein n=1 Tax=Tropicibacter alexandrii TaxID=2267683 RepID=UPI000EF51520|nr:helix-turn-helix transcriptional regulator [Tropicibacter alexandrii]